MEETTEKSQKTKKNSEIRLFLQIRLVYFLITTLSCITRFCVCAFAARDLHPSPFIYSYSWNMYISQLIYSLVNFPWNSYIYAACAYSLFGNLIEEETKTRVVFDHTWILRKLKISIVDNQNQVQSIESKWNKNIRNFFRTEVSDGREIGWLLKNVHAWIVDWLGNAHVPIPFYPRAPSKRM